MNLLRRWHCQLVTASLQATSVDEQVLTPALDWVSTSCQKTNHSLLHPAWTWDGVQPHTLVTCDKTTNWWTSCYVVYHTIVNGCGSRQRHTFSILHYCIVYSQNGNIITVYESNASSYTCIYKAAHSTLYKKDIIISSIILLGTRQL